MARIYDEKKAVSDSEAYKALRYEERPFFVVDNNGQTKCSYGRNTSIANSGYFMITTYQVGDISEEGASEEYEPTVSISTGDEETDVNTDENIDEEYIDEEYDEKFYEEFDEYGSIEYVDKNITVYMDSESEYIEQDVNGEYSVDIAKLFGVEFSLKNGINIDIDL